MTKHLLIAGHGHQRDGSFDPGATGFIKKGEYKYMVENVFPAMRKYIPKGTDIVFYDKLKVSNHGSLVRLVNELKADVVTEFHFDAFTNDARGGHVIVHADFEPDALDLRIRNVINSMVGLRFTHKGQRGISGRANLYNVNMARNNGINYRLLELGFGTSEIDSDVMINRVDEYAKKLVEAILNTKVENQSKPAKSPIKSLGNSYTVKSGDTLSAIAKKYNVSIVELAKYNELSNPNLIRVGEDIEIPFAVVQPSSSPKPKPQKSIDQLAQEVINGKHGLGDARRKSLGSLYTPVQNLVNQMLRATPQAPQKRTTEQMAREVIDGKHGNGHFNRKRSLGISQTEYEKVIRRVNQLA